MKIPKTEIETIVSVDHVVKWLHNDTRESFVQTRTPQLEIDRTVARKKVGTFWRNAIRKPLWVPAHLPCVKTELGNRELGNLVRRSRNANVWLDPDKGDYLAWYLPFHDSKEDWGIYIPVTGILQCAAGIAPSGFKGRWLDLVELALRGLLAHELIHYAIEYRSAQLEMLMGTPCYLAGQTALFQSGHVPLEEQLANGAFLRSIQYETAARKIAGAYESAEAFTKKQPRGYCDGWKSVRTKDFLANANDLMRRIASSLPAGYRLAATDPMEFGGRPAATIGSSTAVVLNGAQCPVYLVRDEIELGVPSGTVIAIR